MVQFSVVYDSVYLVEEGGEGGGLVLLDGYSECLYNEDLVFFKNQIWGLYNIFVFWMLDVYSVGGYVFVGSLFVFGLMSWQVLIVLIVGIGFVNVLCNLIVWLSQQIGVLYLVVCCVMFGVFGVNVLVVICGLIVIVWYGIQIYFVLSVFVIVVLKFFL